MTYDEGKSNGFSRHEIDIENRLRALEGDVDRIQEVMAIKEDVEKVRDIAIVNREKIGGIEMWQKIIGGINAAIGLAVLGLLFKILEHGFFVRP